MFNLFTHPAFHSGIPVHRRFPPQHQNQQQAYHSHPFDMFFNPHTNNTRDEEDDSEEQYLCAALEHKQQQRFARQHYLRQQQEFAKQQRIEQERTLLERQRARAAAQAKYEAEQEAVRQYRLRQKQLREQQRAQMEKEREQAELEAMYLQQQEEDRLTNLLSSLLLPCLHPHSTEQLKPEEETKTNEETETEVEADAEQSQESADHEVDQQQKAAPEDDLVGDYYAANPEIKSLVKNLLGANIENREIEALAETLEESPEKEEEATVEVPVETTEVPEPNQSTGPASTPVSAPSSVHSSPELRAADILKEREQRHLSDKHAQLDSVESTLNNLSSELRQIIAGTLTIKNQILATEENLIRAMFKIDAVESARDSGIRHRRKEMIKRSQELLDEVDAFKRESNPVSVIKAADSVVEPTREVHETEDQDTAAQDVEEDEEYDSDTLSDMKSLPDIESVPEAPPETQAEPEADAPEEDSSLECSCESDQEQQGQEERQEQAVIDPLDHILGSVFSLGRSALRDQDSIFRDLNSIFA
ncbi:hypothetical protein BGZ59_005313 [Podila verticillata]|nr:hypothetical protein BGZ59_005313 [Podila verticillata]